MDDSNETLFRNQDYNNFMTVDWLVWYDSYLQKTRDASFTYGYTILTPKHWSSDTFKGNKYPIDLNSGTENRRIQANQFTVSQVHTPFTHHSSIHNSNFSYFHKGDLKILMHFKYDKYTDSKTYTYKYFYGNESHVPQDNFMTELSNLCRYKYSNIYYSVPEEYIKLRKEYNEKSAISDLVSGTQEQLLISNKNSKKNNSDRYSKILDVQESSDSSTTCSLSSTQEKYPTKKHLTDNQNLENTSTKIEHANMVLTDSSENVELKIFTDVPIHQHMSNALTVKECEKSEVKFIGVRAPPKVQNLQ